MKSLKVQQQVRGKVRVHFSSVDLEIAFLVTILYRRIEYKGLGKKRPGPYETKEFQDSQF